MGETELYQALLHWNPHWAGGEISRMVLKNAQKRRVFHVLQGLLRDPAQRQIRILAGPRQIGKTTTVGHLMKALLDDGVDSRRIIYCPTDLPRIQAETQGHLTPLVDMVERLLLRGPLQESKEDVYLFLDEIHSLDNWANELKALHDTHSTILRVVATGSSSAALLNPEADLPGRAVRHDLYPLKFNEAMEALDPAIFGPGSPIFREAMRARAALAHAEFQDLESLAAALELLWFDVQDAWPVLCAAFDRYLVQGGYPASWGEPETQHRTAFMESTLATALSKDLKHFPSIRKPGAFSEFLGALARDHGGKFSSNARAKDLGVDKETPAHWKGAAEELFLARSLQAMGPDLRPQPRKMEKVYIQDPGVRAYLSAELDLADLERTGRVGEVVEGVVLDHLSRILFTAFKSRRFDLGYLPSPEIDFVGRLPCVELMVECKYSPNPQAGIQALQRILPAREALRVVVTRDTFDVGGPVWCLPAALLCYLV